MASSPKRVRRTMKRDFTGSPKSPIGFLGKRKHNGAVSFSVRKTISGVCADEGVAVKIARRSKPTSDFGNRKRTLFLQERTPRGERYKITPSWKQGGVFLRSRQRLPDRAGYIPCDFTVSPQHRANVVAPPNGRLFCCTFIFLSC